MLLSKGLTKRLFGNSKYPLKKPSGLNINEKGQQKQIIQTGLQNPLRQIIIDEINQKQQGMTLARFMELGLLHPQHGYYSCKDQIFNKGGDFTTSPEISQMFGEMVGLWLMTALKNYQEGPESPEIQSVEQVQVRELNSINIIEIGPGSGIMMSDIIRTLSQFTGNLKNIQINLIEASNNLCLKQQDKLLKQLKDKHNMFLTYDLELHKFSKEAQTPVEKFMNTDQNFSIAWFPSLKHFYNMYLENQLKQVKEIKAKMEQLYPHEEQAKRMTARAVIENQLQNPCFVLAHELYDALPIHQFQFSQDRKWREKLVRYDKTLDNLDLSIEEGTLVPQYEQENIQNILKPEKLFTKEILKDIKPGDQIEVCPQAITLTQEIISLVELSRGNALIIDYGEDHAFTNSFRGIKNHQVVKDFKEICDNVGQIDLTSYVNFAQIKKIAQNNENLIVNGPMPQGLFLESMGINMRKEILQKYTKTEQQRKILEESYYRLCHPQEMGEIYKMMYFGHKDVGDIYPFIGEQTAKEQEMYG
eukprot:403374808